MLNKVIEFVSLIIFSSMVLAITVNVFARLTNNSIVWLDEFSRYTFVWIVFLGTTIAVKKHYNIVFDMLLNILTVRLSAILSIIIDLFVIYICVVLFKSSLDLTINTWPLPTTAMGISTGILYSVVPFSSIIISWYLIFDIWNKIKTFRYKEGVN